MADLMGQTLGEYRIEALVGRGPTGDVYRGTHLHRAQRAAVKIVSGGLSGDPGFPARFHAEMQAVAALHHPHIVEVYAVGAQQGLCYIVTELVTAGSVRALLRHRPPGEPWPLPLALDLARQAAEGLGHAHARGFVHKDIKPSNLLLSAADGLDGRQEERYVLKIADFGLAPLAESGSDLTSSGVALGAGVLLGAPPYMSPEQCKGRRMDARSDIYALGVVLYEMVTGYLPFQVSSLREAVREHVFTPPPLPRLLNPEVPPAVELILLRCLAKRPEDRYETAAELAAALRVAAPVAM